MKEYRLRVKEKIMKADLATIRREYTKGGLKRSDLPDNPLVLFNLFFILTMEVARVNIWLITHLSLYRLYGMNWKGKFI